jgi:hypothetical protein
MTILKYVGLLMLGVSGMLSRAAEADCRQFLPISQSITGAKSIGDFVQIQKSFSGSLQDSKAPAEFGYQNPDSGRAFVHADLGLKTISYQFFECGRFATRIAPTAEYHQSSEQYNEVKKFGGGGVLQTDFAFDQDAHTLLMTDLQFKYTRDDVLAQSTRTETITTAISSANRGWPGFLFRDGNQRVFRYMPSIGYERDQNLAIKYKSGSNNVLVAPPVNVSFYTGAVTAQYLPFTRQLCERLVLTVGDTWRRLIGGSDTLPRSSHLLETSLDYYVDSQQRFAIGFNYQRGRDPKRNFLEEAISSAGFKFQLGGDVPMVGCLRGGG